MTPEHAEQLARTGLTQAGVDAIARSFASYVAASRDGMKKNFATLHVESLRQSRERLQEMMGAQQWLPLSLSQAREELRRAAISIREIYEVAEPRFKPNAILEADPAESMANIIGVLANQLDAMLTSNPSLKNVDTLPYTAAKCLYDVDTSNVRLYSALSRLEQTFARRGFRILSEPVEAKPLSKQSDQLVDAVVSTLSDYVDNHYDTLRSHLLGVDDQEKEAAVVVVRDILAAESWALNRKSQDVHGTLVKQVVGLLETVHDAVPSGTLQASTDPYATDKAVSRIVARQAFEMAVAKTHHSGARPPAGAEQQVAIAVHGLHAHYTSDPHLKAAFAMVEAFASEPKAAPRRKPSAGLAL